MSSVVKGNRPLRIFAGMMLLLLLVSHFMGQVDLTQISFLWLMIFMALNALQATFTGFCPMFKNAKGECVACGVLCDDGSCSSGDVKTSKKSEACCCSAGSCCAEEKKSDSLC